MQKRESGARGDVQEPGVDQVLDRIAAAFHAATQAEWMAKLEVQPETVRTWRKRGFVPISKIARAAELSGKPVEWFRLRPQEAPERAEAPKAWTPENGPPEYKVALDVQQYILVPKLNVRVSAGNGTTVDAEDEIGQFAFKRSWLARKGVNPSSLRVITAKGRSMEPTVRDRDILLVDTSPQSHLNDGIYVLNYAGDSICKRLMRLVDGGLRIFSDNAAEFPPQDVRPGDLEQVRVVGKVIWVGGER